MLVIDTQLSGLLGKFDDYFLLRGHPEVVLRNGMTEQQKQKDWLGVWPPLDKSRLSWKEFMDPSGFGNDLRSGQEILLKPNLARNYSEELLVYQAFGGGIASHSLVEELEVTTLVREWLEEKRKALPSRYVGLHIRHSDYRSDVSYFLDQVKKANIDLPIFLATDNHDIFTEAVSMFPDGQIFGFSSNRGITPGTPLHNPSNRKPPEWQRETVLMAFADLFALSGSHELHFPFVYVNQKRNRMKASGFSLLAQHLHDSPLLFERFFQMERPNPFIVQKQKIRPYSPKMMAVVWLNYLSRAVLRPAELTIH